VRLIEAPQYAELATTDTPLGTLVNDWLLFYEKRHRNSMGVGGATHDPLVPAIDPTLVCARPAHIGVDLSGSGNSRGSARPGAEDRVG